MKRALGSSGVSRQAGDSPVETPMRSRTLAESFGFAVDGILYAFQTQRNLRVHCLMAVLVLLLALSLRVNRTELAVLAITVGAVMSAELFNTAIEAVVDLLTREYHPLARVAKNVAAGGVLVTAVAAAFVGYALFVPRLLFVIQGQQIRGIATPASLTIGALALVLLAVVFLKAQGGRFQLQGGMPSGHTALAFALATSVFFVTQSGAAVLLAALIAALVAQSRIEARIHRWPEVVAGALLGILVTLLVFQLLA